MGLGPNLSGEECEKLFWFLAKKRSEEMHFSGCRNHWQLSSNQVDKWGYKILVIG
jgi:hypothetical protein